jgi:hypothetical protein
VPRFDLGTTLGFVGLAAFTGLPAFAIAPSLMTILVCANPS